MHGEEHRSRVALREQRERTIETLSAAFARDELGLEEFEERLDRAWRCAREEEFGELTADLSGSPGLAVVSTATSLTATAAPPVALRAVLGSIERAGSFDVPHGSRVSALLGNVELDLREVSFPPGVTELHVRAVLGNVELTLPPTLAVECTGRAMLGSFETTSRLPAVAEPDAPLLRVVGSAILGNVEIRTRVRRH